MNDLTGLDIRDLDVRALTSGILDVKGLEPTGGE